MTCVDKLLNFATEEDIESVCKLIETCGGHIYQQRANSEGTYRRFHDGLKRLYALQHSDIYSFRLKCLIKDVHDMEKRRYLF